MVIDDLIEQLTKESQLAHMGRQDKLVVLLSKAAEAIRLMREVISEEQNEKYKMQIDEILNGGK